MTFEEILDHALAMLQRRRRVTYSTLKLQFQLDDVQLAALKDELLYSQPQVVDDAGRGLVWTGDRDTPPDRAPAPRPTDAEGRKRRVMFWALVEPTRLSGQLDPEDLRAVVRAYQSTCAEV